MNTSSDLQELIPTPADSGWKRPLLLTITPMLDYWLIPTLRLIFEATFLFTVRD
jgi:hypothetical protein